MDENTTVEEMLQALFGAQMQLFYDQCELIFSPLEDIMKGEEIPAEEFEAA